MKPSGVLLFVVSVFLLLLAISLYFPKEGIQLTKSLKLRFFSPVDILPENNETYADIGEIIRMQELLNDTIIEEFSKEILVSDTAKANRNELIASITRVEYPDGDSTLLHPFFSLLKNAASSGNLVRILHYGDSQIEDDRITSYLRYRLQSRFGGSGVGLVPAAQFYPYSSSMMQTNSDNWYRYVVCGRIDTTLTHNRYGALGGFGMFTPAEGSGTTVSSAAEAWIRFSPSRFSYENTRSFRQCRIYYGFNRQPFIVELFLGDSLFDAEMLPVSKEMKAMDWKFDAAQEDLTIQFSGESSPEIYGIALDDDSGIAVDNIALRGCSGPFLTSMDKKTLADMYRELNAGLFILQFGGNMVPAEIDNFKGYENWFVNQISMIRETCPDAAILVIGVADMSTRERDHYVTDPNVEKVRDALRNAAFRSDAAFWDMYKAMGGRNSMPSWVNAHPSLAAGDFVHFNPLGAKTIAQMFYNAFILEYQRFEKHAQP